MKKKAVVVLSGGMDSGTLLYYVALFREVWTLTVDYGQRHGRELHSARALSEASCGSTSRHTEIDLTSLKLPGSSQTDESVPVPRGHYAAENMKLTVVPNRNMVLLSLAVAHAISLGADEVYYGAHAGDHDIYPDCRPEFVEAIQKAVALCDWSPAQVLAPFMTLDKAAILRLGHQLGVPYEKTWTCYEGKDRPCELCGACRERAEAWAEVGRTDPLVAE